MMIDPVWLNYRNKGETFIEVDQKKGETYLLKGLHIVAALFCYERKGGSGSGRDN